MNPSLANRLRIGFAITFALLAGVTVIGVGRLFQLRQDYEDKTTRSFQLEIAGEHLRQAFLLEQASLRGAPRMPSGAEDRFAGRRCDADSRQGTRADWPSTTRRPSDCWTSRSRPRSNGGAWSPSRRWTDAAPARTPGGSCHPGQPGRRRADRQSRPVSAGASRQGHRRHPQDRAAGRGRTGIRPDRGGAAVLGPDRLDATATGAPGRRIREARREATCRRGSRSAGRPRPRPWASPSTRWPTSCRAPIAASRRAAAAAVTWRASATAWSPSIPRRRHRRQPRRRRLVLGGDRRLADPRGPGRRRVPPRRSSGCWRAASRGARTREGGTVLAITGSKLGAQEGGSVLSIRDVSERARLERMKDEFVLTASHELRSPLTSVQGFAELLMLEREDQLPEAGRDGGDHPRQHPAPGAAAQRPPRPGPQRRRAG